MSGYGSLFERLGGEAGQRAGWSREVAAMASTVPNGRSCRPRSVQVRPPSLVTAKSTTGKTVAPSDPETDATWSPATAT